MPENVTMVDSLKKKPEKLFSLAVSQSHQEMLKKLSEHYAETLGFKIPMKAVAEKAIADLYKKLIIPLAEGE